MTHLILIQHFSTTFALKDRSNSEIIFHANPIYLYESQELEEMRVSKPYHDLSHRHCTHDFHFVKSIHLTRNSICHSWSYSSPSSTFFHFSSIPLCLTSHPLQLLVLASSLLPQFSELKWSRAQCTCLSNFPLKVSFIPRTLSTTSVRANLTFASPVQIFLLKSRTCQLI